MRTAKACVGFLIAGGLLLAAPRAVADPPADDFLNPQDPGPRLTLMPFFGPGFRAIYDHRIEVEEEVTELRSQLMGTVAIPFAEVSENLDLRLFLMQFGASVGYHDEWHMLQFNPSPATGRDTAGQPDPSIVQGTPEPIQFNDLDRRARRLKDQNADIKSGRWPFYELRWGFLWPAQDFIGVSTLAARHDGRPDVTYDWENGTVYNGGWHLRYEGYALFRSRRLGFIGPAIRALYVPRNRIRGNATIRDPDDMTAPEYAIPEGSACQADEPLLKGQCVQTHEFELHYGILAGMRPNWITSSDTFLIRTYGAWGLDSKKLFGTHTFGQPWQLLVAYMADIDL